MKKCLLVLTISFILTGYGFTAPVMGNSGKLDDGYSYKTIGGTTYIYDSTGAKAGSFKKSVNGNIDIYDANNKKIGTSNSMTGATVIEAGSGNEKVKIKITPNGEGMPSMEFSELNNLGGNLKINPYGKDGTHVILDPGNGEVIEEILTPEQQSIYGTVDGKRINVTEELRKMMGF